MAGEHSVFETQKELLEEYEQQYGKERGRLATATDLITDALVLIGQHGVYCTSARNPVKPQLDIEKVLTGLKETKELLLNLMEELKNRKK